METVKWIEDLLGVELKEYQMQLIVDHYSVENGKDDSQEKQTL